MILVDTSIWIDHLHRPVPALVELLARTQVSTHPMVMALGSLPDRAWVLGLLADLPATPVATPAEVLLFVDLHGLSGLGLSLVDAHLLAALRLSARDRLWTRDRRLREAAGRPRGCGRRAGLIRSSRLSGRCRDTVELCCEM